MDESFYKDITFCVTNKGHASDFFFFNLFVGFVKDALWVIFFIWSVVKFDFKVLRNDKNIKDINIMDTEIIVSS